MGSRLALMCKELVKKNANYQEGKQMKKKFKIIDASTGKEFKLIDGQMIVMNNEGVFFWVGNFRDYVTYVRKLSDVCPRYEVVWNDE